MDWFYNLKLKAKLLTALSIGCLIALIVVAYALIQGKYADDRDTFLYEKSTVPIGQLAVISSDFQRFRINVMRRCYEKDPQEAENNIKKIQKFNEEIHKYFKEYETTFIDKNDEESYNKLVENYNKFYSEYERVLNYMNSDQQDLALESISPSGNFTKLGLSITDHLAQMVNNNIEAARQTSDNNTSEYQSTRNITIIMLLLGTLLSFTIFIKLSNYLSKAINGVVAKIKEIKDVNITKLSRCGEQLANGDLNIDLDSECNLMKVSSNDELGILTDSANQICLGIQNTINSIGTAVESIKGTVTESNILVQAAVIGKLSTRGDESKFKGSYRLLIEGLNKTFEAVVKPIHESSKVLENLAQGDLTTRMSGEYKGDYAIIKNSINNLGSSISSALSEVAAATHATASASSEISSSSEQMAAGAQEQSAQTTEIAGAVEQMTKTIMETTKHASVAAESSKTASIAAQKGALKIAETKRGMERIVNSAKTTASIVSSLAQKSDQIGEITQVIDDIADQTNLLALNAAIEAARAGEQGRGFAVVADEVRKLAERTTKATKEIADTIKTIQKEAKDADDSMLEAGKSVQSGMELTEEVSESLSEIQLLIGKVSDMINQVAAASEEQSSAAEQISKNIEGINNVTHESAAGVQQIAKASEDLNQLTTTLQNLVQQFVLEKEVKNNIHHNRNELLLAS